jgi:XTP/dITP diphosphohydrolase
MRALSASGSNRPERPRFVLATGNRHKLEEFRSLARSCEPPLEVISADAVGGMPAVAEDGGSFVENAGKKARALRVIAPRSLWVLADDSGLCVDALDGGPGVNSAYYAGPKGDSAANLAKMVEAMREVPAGRRGARFICVLVALGPRQEENVFEGRCDGRLGFAPLGHAGFGYDPIFLPEGYEQSFAQLAPAVKNEISHRARAWRKLTEYVRAVEAGHG